MHISRIVLPGTRLGGAFASKTGASNAHSSEVAMLLDEIDEVKAQLKQYIKHTGEDSNSKEEFYTFEDAPSEESKKHTEGWIQNMEATIEKQPGLIVQVQEQEGQLAGK